MKPTIPDAALQQHIAILGKTGAGKTTAAKSAIVEPMLTAGRRVAVIDPTSAWWGLRTSRDGKGPGFPILVLGGDHGDLPLPALGGAAVARLVAEQNVNLVADTSALTVGERTRWFIDFATTLYRLNRAPLCLVIDEAHMFMPQGKVPDPDTGKMLHAGNTLASGGRSRGIRLVMLTQRPQKLHKDALTSADTLIALRVLAPHDRQAIEDWIKGCGDLKAGAVVLNSLASLQRGEGWVWYPEGSVLDRVTFPPIKTFDSSATPTDGATIATPKGSAEIDLTEIKAAMADAVAEAEANDPKKLRARIAELEREAKTAAPAVDPAALAAEYERGRRESVERVQKAAREAIAPALALLDTIAERLPNARAGLIFIESVRPATDSPRPTSGPNFDAGAIASAINKPPAHVRAPTHAVPAGAAPKRAISVPAAAGDSSVTRPQQHILETLAMLESVGIAQPSRTQLALWADVSPTSGGFFNNLGALRSAGLIEYPSGGTVALTEAGRERAPTPAPMSTEEMQESLCAKVGNAKANILRALIAIYPKDITRDALAERIEVSSTSGGYFNNLGALRSLGVLDYPSPGRVVALPVLFLE